ncbi:MAG: phage portal protein [Phycisphaeraceae bacterium]|nr:phage portal protein [Phycisphaeraceae bacterium]
MAFQLQPFADLGLDAALLEHLIARHEAGRARLERLWDYYRNPEVGPAHLRVAAGSVDAPSRPRLAQEQGLPGRITGLRDVSQDDRTRTRREVVIENDIGWRIQAMVDFMFGKPVLITSTAREEATRKTVERVLDAVWEASGGIALLQDMALLGHVYGHVDLLLREVETIPDADDPAAAAAQALRVEVVEPLRGIPLQSPDDYRRLEAYIIRSEREVNAVEPGLGAARWAAFWRATSGEAIEAVRRVRSTCTEVLSAAHRQVYRDGRLVESRPWEWTREVPVVHIQNISQPFRYAGMSDVEPLIPLQDELNTRLSDRACRVTMQSFKMYLGKGITGFDKVPVGPGQIWSTENPDASVEEFGGDASSPSEEAHILEIREALDKTSGVPPLASGVVRAKIGNLSSANALRITLMGVLSKTARKRVTYGRGVAQMCSLVLEALDAMGILRTDPADRGVKLVWPDPLPEDLSEAAAAARTKRELGVPADRVLAELGYSGVDAGVM